MAGNQGQYQGQEEEEVDLKEVLLRASQTSSDVKEEQKRALAIYNRSDLSTQAAMAKQLILREKTLQKAVEVGVDTIARVSTERDYYKEMIGEGVNNANVQEALEYKISRQNKNAKNRIAMSEIYKTLETNNPMLKHNSTTSK